MTEVCRAFGISRKTEYKLFERYRQEGDCPTSITLSTTATSSSQPAAASACTERKSTSPPFLAGQRLGLKEVDDAIWLVSFMTYHLGYIDQEQNVTHVSGRDKASGGCGDRI